MTEIHCVNCNYSFPSDGVPYRCPKCGGIFDFDDIPVYNPSLVDDQKPGIWKYKHLFGLGDSMPEVFLGEGNTPLVYKNISGKKIGFKLEYLNPTGSFKDRGTAPLVSFLKSRSVKTAIEDSSGNAGASFAAYAAYADIEAKVYVPSYASGPKRRQIQAYGAEVIPVEGPRSKATELVMKKAASGQIYASHAYLPFGLPGYATVAYELYRQIGKAPGTVITPVGQGNLFLGAFRGFISLKKAGLIKRIPKMIGVQALACAPLWAVYKFGSAGLGWVTEGETLAEGVRILHPLRGDKILELVMEYDGELVSVEEENIRPGWNKLAQLGFYTEPTSAIVWDALEQVINRLPEPIVLVLTGSGLKTDLVIN